MGIYHLLGYMVTEGKKKVLYISKLLLITWCLLTSKFIFESVSFITFI